MSFNKVTVRLIIIVSILTFGNYNLHAQNKTLYDFNANTIDGKIFDFSTLKGKKVMIVNTASECAFTPQFKKLQDLYEEYGGDDFEIIGFPCNDFGGQEPADNDVIYDFCTSKYGVTFTMMEKISIKGDDVHPIFRWLTSSEENGTLDAKVTWNFQKFLIDKNGEVVDAIAPITGPQNRRIIDWLMED
jgi:glutathione peroxidase